MQEKSLAVFESKKIRRYYDAQTETWYFSAIDAVEALTVSINPTDYLKKLRKRDIELGAYIGKNCPQVEMVTETGKSVITSENYLPPAKRQKQLKHKSVSSKEAE